MNMEIWENHYTRITLEPHERLYLASVNGTNDRVQVDALHDGQIFFSGGNDIIEGFEGINPDEIEVFEDEQPFATSKEETIVVEGYGVAISTPSSEMTGTCVYVNTNAEGKLTISGGQSMIYGTACIDLSKFSNQATRKMS